MVSYNRFGAAFADVIALYPGTQASDYGTASGVANATAGQAAIEAALDYYSRLAANALSSAHYAQITAPQAELIDDCTTAGQTSFELGIYPVVTGSVHLFRFSSWPGHMPAPVYGNGLGHGEIETDNFSVTDSTGAINYTGPDTFLAGEMVFASYKVDTANASFSLPAMADVVIRGAASELGSRLYTQGTSEWLLVEKYQSAWDSFLEANKSGQWIDDTLRNLRWWDEAEKQGGISSIRIARG